MKQLNEKLKQHLVENYNEFYTYVKFISALEVSNSINSTDTDCPDIALDILHDTYIHINDNLNDISGDKLTDVVQSIIVEQMDKYRRDVFDIDDYNREKEFSDGLDNLNNYRFDVYERVFEIAELYSKQPKISKKGNFSSPLKDYHIFRLFYATEELIDIEAIDAHTMNRLRSLSLAKTEEIFGLCRTTIMNATNRILKRMNLVAIKSLDI